MTVISISLFALSKSYRKELGYDTWFVDYNFAFIFSLSQQEKERSDRASFVEQAPLQLNRDPRYDFKLRDLQIRPNLGGKKLTVSEQSDPCNAIN